MAVRKVNFFFSTGCVSDGMSIEVTGATAMLFPSLIDVIFVEVVEVFVLGLNAVTIFRATRPFDRTEV